MTRLAAALALVALAVAIRAGIAWWADTPQSRQTAARRARSHAARAASVPHGCAVNGAGGAL